jgi:hypothetical protein
MRKFFRLSTILACVLAVSSIARGQGQPTPSNPWIHVTRVDVQPGAVAEFEDYIKKIQAGRAKLGLPNPVTTYQTVMGGNTYHYEFVLPFVTWNEMDANPSIASIVTKAYGEVEGAKILKAGRSTIQAVTVEVYRVRLDLSTNVKAGAPPDPFVTLTVTEHHGETLPDYIRLLGKIKKAEEQDPSNPTVLRYVLNLGEGSVTVAARGSKTLAERTTFPNQAQILTKVYGEADARDMNELITKTIAKRSTVVLAYRPDLSSPGK